MMLELTTDVGTIRLFEPVDGGCSGCGSKRDVTEIRVPGLTDAGTDPAGFVCGVCLAAALAVRLGAAHVAAGGRLEDLRRDVAGSD